MGCYFSSDATYNIQSLLEIRNVLCETEDKVPEQFIKQFMNSLPGTTNIYLEFTDGWHATRSIMQKKSKSDNTMRVYLLYLGLHNNDKVGLTDQQVQLYNDIKMMIRRKSLKLNQIAPLTPLLHYKTGS